MGKTKAKNPTLAQKKLMAAAGLIPRNWYVLKETEEELHLVSKGSGKTRKISKKEMQEKLEKERKRR